MELDELKILFKEKMSKPAATKSEDDILLILAGKTHSIIGKLKRSLRIELVACVIFALGCAAVALFAVPVWLKIYFSVFAVLCAFFFPVLWFLLQKTKKLSDSILPLKTNLELIVKILNEYVKRYFQLTMLLIPVSLLIAVFLIYTDARFNGRSNPLMQLDSKGVIFSISYIILFSVGMYFFTKWYLRKLYGNYIEQLQQLIKELEE